MRGRSIEEGSLKRELRMAAMLELEAIDRQREHGNCSNQKTDEGKLGSYHTEHDRYSYFVPPRG